MAIAALAFAFFTCSDDGGNGDDDGYQPVGSGPIAIAEVRTYAVEEINTGEGYIVIKEEEIDCKESGRLETKTYDNFLTFAIKNGEMLFIDNDYGSTERIYKGTSNSIIGTWVWENGIYKDTIRVSNDKWERKKTGQLCLGEDKVMAFEKHSENYPKGYNITASGCNIMNISYNGEALMVELIAFDSPLDIDKSVVHGKLTYRGKSCRFKQSYRRNLTQSVCTAAWNAYQVSGDDSHFLWDDWVKNEESICADKLGVPMELRN